MFLARSRGTFVAMASVPIVDEIASLAARAMPREEFFAELAPRLRRVIDSDATCWHTLDPYTRLMTSDAPAELIERGIYTAECAPSAGELMARSEYLIEDFNTFASLAGRRVPVGSLDQATRGRPERSTRYRELLVPSGIPHELRAAFVLRGRAWGAVHIARRESSGPFTDQDVQMLTRVTSAIAQAIRGSLRFDAARRGDHPEAPGLIVLDASNSVELVTPPAYELLAAIRSEAAVYPMQRRPRPCSVSRRMRAAATTARLHGPTRSRSRARSAGSACMRRSLTGQGPAVWPSSSSAQLDRIRRRSASRSTA
jgi:hypothetical protein